MAGSPLNLAVTAPATARAGEGFSPPVVVTVIDGYGNPVGTAAQVTLAIDYGPPGSTLGGVTSLPAPAGTATFDAAWVDKLGSYTLRASALGYLSQITGSITVTAGPPASAHFLQTPWQAQAGVAFDAPVMAGLRDRFGNECPTASAPELSLYLGGADSGAGALVGDTTATPVNGVATFSPVAVDRAGDYVLFVAGAGVGGDVSPALHVDAGPVVKLLVAGPARATTGDEVWLRATAVDVRGATQTGYQGAATVTSSDASAELPWDPVPLVDGQSEPMRVVFHAPGVQEVTLRDGAGIEGVATVEVVERQPGGGGGGGGGCETGGAGAGSALALAFLGARPWRRRLRGRPAEGSS
jgi:hypothetical protein